MEINIVKLKEYAQHCNVLYVEDDELIRTQTVEFLNRFFPIIDVAVNGLEGLEKYDPVRYSIVITDINMPKMNGIEMIEEIRKRNEDQIVLVTSAYNDSVNLIHLINLGIHRFIIKPFNFKQFIIMLYYIVEDIYIRSQNNKMINLTQKIVDLMDNGVIVFENFNISMVNKAFLNMGGFKRVETLLLEMPEIGVMFQPCGSCLSGTTNSELIKSLQTLPPSHHKVRIEKKSQFQEYQVKISDLGNENIALIFTDITAIHDELYLDIHTALPMKKALLEQMEILGDQKETFYALLITIKNYDSLLKYYRKSDAINVEKEASIILKEIFPQINTNTFIGHYGQNKFVIINDKHFDEIDLHRLESSVIRYIIDLNIQKIIREGDLHLSYKSKEVSFKAKISLPKMEEILNNEFDLI